MKALHKDEHYKRFYEAVHDDVIEKEFEDLRRQIQTVLWCCVRVAMDDEKISNSKANRILAQADTYYGYNMTADEFRDWCREETGMEVNVD